MFIDIGRHIEEIDENGYTKISGVYSEEEIDKALSLVKELYNNLPETPDHYTPRLNKNSPNIYNLHAKDKFFIDLLFKSEELEKLFIRFLNDEWYKQIPQDQPNFILRHMGARSTTVALPLHIDSFVPTKDSSMLLTMQMAIMLEDSTEETGCTVVCPGSHTSGMWAQQNHKKYKPVLLEAKKGDVLIWNGSLWHGTSENKTDRTRWSIITTFSRHFIKQMFDLVNNTPKEIWDQLTPKQKSILGACSVPALDETKYIDQKRGYDIL